MSSVEHRSSTIAVASILIARGKEETPAGNLDALKAILGSSCPHLDTVSPSSRAVPCRRLLESLSGGCWRKAQ
jgi:hypothetical protein